MQVTMILLTLMALYLRDDRRIMESPIDEARNTFKKYKWPTIDITRKSVEETAASIIKIYEIYKQND